MCKKGNQLILKRILKKNETYKISHSSKFDSISIFKKPQVLKGISSYCADGKHVLFIDYDNVPRWLVEQDFKILQETYYLPISYLFSTKEKEDFGNYHIICLSKFYPKEIYEIVSKTHADVNFMSMPIRNKYRNWILRISDKRHKDRPKYISLIGNKVNLNSPISRAHLEFLKRLYNLDEVNYTNLDDNKEIFIQEYEAS